MKATCFSVDVEQFIETVMYEFEFRLITHNLSKALEITFLGGSDHLSERSHLRLKITGDYLGNSSPVLNSIEGI